MEYGISGCMMGLESSGFLVFGIHSMTVTGTKWGRITLFGRSVRRYRFRFTQFNITGTGAFNSRSDASRTLNE